METINSDSKTKITVATDCGNSPKIEFLKVLNIAFAHGDSDLHGIQWSYSGDFLAYNRKVAIQTNSFYQIFTLTRNEN